MITLVRFPSTVFIAAAIKAFTSIVVAAEKSRISIRLIETNFLVLLRMLIMIKCAMEPLINHIESFFLKQLCF